VAPPPDPARVAALAKELNLPSALCALLVVRGFGTPDAARNHLRPRLQHLHPPEGLAGAEEAVARILRAVREGETILVHGDYDVDGVSAATLFTRWLRIMGASVVPFVPHRMRDGYDLGSAGIARARAAGATLLITADSGIVAHAAVAEAAALGIDVIVTDHHTPSDSLPGAVAVVNPNRRDCTYPEKGLSGTGVAFKLCQLLALRSHRPTEELLPLLELVALATIADLVPLTGENRTLVRYGLRALQATTTPGLRALLKVAAVEGVVEAGQVAFRVAPRVNAAGRMGDAGDALRLLLSTLDEEAAPLAEELDLMNRARQEEEGRTLEAALSGLSEGFSPERDFGVVLAGEGWHPGVIGIVASRIVERIHRPVVLVALDGERGRGSARSIPGFHLYEAVAACSGHLERFGGHRQAAGMDVRADRLEGFREAFSREAALRCRELDLRPLLRVDAGITFQEITPELVRFLPYLGPFGMGNPRPVFMARDVELLAPPQVVKGDHLRFRMRQGSVTLEGMGFRLASRVSPEVLAGGRVDAVFQLDEDEWRGVKRVRALIQDVRPAGADGEG
jgi:single-stranded-DNA-specific exonuclease